MKSKHPGIDLKSFEEDTAPDGLRENYELAPEPTESFTETMSAGPIPTASSNASRIA
jgi:hypothetical protein